MNADDRDRLGRILASFDEAGLVAWPTRALSAGAQKDLEAGGLGHEETAAAVVVRGPGWVVTMPPDGPAHATDDTRRQRGHAANPRGDDLPARPLGRRAPPAARRNPTRRGGRDPACRDRSDQARRRRCSAWNSTTWRSGRARRSCARRWPDVRARPGSGSRDARGADAAAGPPGNRGPAAARRRETVGPAPCWTPR